MVILFLLMYGDELVISLMLEIHYLRVSLTEHILDEGKRKAKLINI